MSAPTTTKAQRTAADYTLGTPHARTTVITTPELLVIPTDCVGKFVRFHADAGSGSAVAVWIRFGTADTVVATIGDRSAIDGSGNLTADVNVPHLAINAGADVRVRLDPSWTHISHISTATTGCLRFALAEGPGV